MSDNYFRLVGSYFGYPSCCIESFIEFYRGLSERTKEQKFFFNQGKGFVPCSKCAKYLIQNNLPSDTLIKGRKSKYRYPCACSEEIFKFK